MHPIILIVFLPLIAAIVAGLGGRVIGKLPAKIITTGALLIGAALSWPIFLSFVAGHGETQVVPVLDWIRSGDLQVDWALRVDALTAVQVRLGGQVEAQQRTARSRDARNRTRQ